MVYSIEKINKYVPVTVTDHDVSYMKCARIARELKNPAAKCFMALESIKIKNLEKNLYKYANTIITVSEYDKKIIKDLSGKGKYIVIENGVDIKKFKKNNKDKIDQKIVWLGGFKQLNNAQAVEYFIKQIYYKIKKEVEKVKFDVIGEEPT